MNGSVSMNGNTLLSGGLTVNTDGVVEPIEINITENGDRTITAHAGLDGYNPITIHTNVPQQTDPILDDITITENGNYTPPSGTDGYNDITVNVPQQSTPVLDEITITENGTYTPPEGTDGYNDITVNVPQQSAPVLDDITIIENGTYTPPTGTDGYNDITVNVPQSTPVLDEITITENGTYTPPEGTDGYNDITVNVPQSTPVLDEITITENGTYTPPEGTDGYDEITVNVPLPENAYLLEEYEDVPTDIASFTASDAPLKSLTASIVPVQAGSGDPSPTNVRPISGWTEEEIEVAHYYENLTLESGSFDEHGTEVNNTRRCRINHWIEAIDRTYTVTVEATNSSETAQIAVSFFDSSYERIFDSAWQSSGYSVEKPSGAKYVRAVYRISTDRDVSPSDFKNVKIYTDLTTYTIPFTDSQGQSVEVFGGSVDVINGVVTPCPYYASYNGEQLTGEWISDRDVYSPNTSPTIGAQVVNIGATDTSFSTQPTSIKSLDGDNNVWASTGQIENLEFFTKEE